MLKRALKRRTIHPLRNPRQRLEAANAQTGIETYPLAGSLAEFLRKLEAANAQTGIETTP